MAFNDEMLSTEVRHLLLVTAVADQGSLAGAAKVLNLTPSALSHQLHDIEERLGTALFHRVGKRMLLSPAGEKFVGPAREVVATLTRVEDEIRAFVSGSSGVL